MKKIFAISKYINGPAFDSILLAFIQFITYTTNIVTTKMLSIELSLTEYGTYSIVNSIITIAASFTLFGLGDSINYYYNNKNRIEDKTEYVNTIFFIQLIIGVIVGIILMFTSENISNYYKNPAAKSLVLIVCMKPWISNATHLYQVLFVSSGKSKLITFRNLIISILKVVLLYISISFFDSLFAVFLCLVFLDVLQLAAFKYIFGKTNFKIDIFCFSRDKVMPIIKYCVPMGIYFISITLMREIDKLIIGRFGTIEELAIYTNCAKILPLNILVASLATVLIPYIMKSVTGGDYRAAIRILRKYLTVGYLSVWMFSGALLLCAPEAIRFFYSSEYLSGTPIFMIYIVDGMIQFASFHLVIAANGNSNFLMFTSILLLITNSILGLGLYYIFNLFGKGIFGPAVATIIVSIIYVLILCIKTSRILKIGIISYLPIGSMLAYICELTFVGAIFAIAKYRLLLTDIHWITIFIGICISYCLVILLLNKKRYKQLFFEINKIKQLGL